MKNEINYDDEMLETIKNQKIGRRKQCNGNFKFRKLDFKMDNLTNEKIDICGKALTKSKRNRENFIFVEAKIF